MCWDLPWEIFTRDMMTFPNTDRDWLIFPASCTHTPKKNCTVFLLILKTIHTLQTSFYFQSAVLFPYLLMARTKVFTKLSKKFIYLFKKLLCKLLLILALSRIPTVLVSFCLSEPARSTRLSWLSRTLLTPAFSSCSQKHTTCMSVSV
jgi:hypothetical protein